MVTEQEDNLKIVGTKLSIPAWRRFKRALDKVGITAYSAFQNFADVFVRYGDDRHNLTPEMESLMSTFEHCEGWDKNFNLADPEADPEIAEATYYLRDKNKKGVRVVHVELPFFGNWTQTFNVKQILEKFLCLTFPQLYMRLRELAFLQDCTSILELLINIVNERESEEDKLEFRRAFEDAERSEWGRTPNTQPFKIRHRRSPDEMDSPSLFGDDEFNDQTESNDEQE